MANKSISFDTSVSKYWSTTAYPAQYICIYFHVDVYEVESTIDIVNNRSQVYAVATAKIYGETSGTVSTFGRSISGGSINVNGSTTNLPSGTTFHNNDIAVTTSTMWVTHDAITGEKSINISCSFSASGGGGSGSKTFALTKIPRGTIPVLSPELIDKPTQNLTITATRTNSSYKHTIKWCVIPNGSVDSQDPPAAQWTTLVTKGTTESFTVTYNDLKAKLDADGAYVGIIRVNAVTYDSDDNYVGPSNGTSVNSKIKTGMIPLALYDDLSGGVGVTLTGSPSGREGIFVDDKGPFEITQVTLNIGGQNKTGYILFCEG